MSEASKIPPGAYYALAIVGLTNAMSLLDRNILAILAPQIMKDLNIGNAEMGLLYGTVFALFYALFSLPMGRLADGWLRGKLLAISIFFWSLSTGMAAFAGGFAMLALSRLGVGVGEAATQPAGTSLVYDYWPKERRGFVMAVLAASIAVGLGGSNILGGYAAGWWNEAYPQSSFRGWQFAFLVAAIPGFILAALLWKLREPVRGEVDGIVAVPDPAPFRASAQVLGSVTPGFNWIHLSRRGASNRQWLINLATLTAIVLGVIAASRFASSIAPRPALNFGFASINPHVLQWSIVGFGTYVIVNLFQGLRLTDKPAHAVLTGSPALILCMVVGGLQSVINYGIMGFTPTFLMKNFDLTPAQVGLKFGLLSAAIGILGPMIAGPVSDKINHIWPGKGRIWVTLFSLGVSPLLAFWLYSARDADSFYIRFVAYSIVLTMWLPPLYAVMYDQVLPRMRGITTSVYLLLVTILGLGIGPYVVGLIADANNGDLAKAILSINWVAPLIVILLILLTTRAKRDEDLLVERARAAGEPI